MPIIKDNKNLFTLDNNNSTAKQPISKINICDEDIQTHKELVKNIKNSLWEKIDY